MKDCGIGCKSFRENESNKKKKVKDSRDYKNHCFGKDFQGRYSWPSRSYTCNFCKREFRSAQALGGHMNVHRRDRARLNQSPLWNGPYPDLNPIFKSTRLPSFTHPFPSLLSSSPTHLSSQTCASSGEKSSAIEASPQSILNSKSGDSTEMKTMKALYGVGELQSFMQEDECKILKKAKIVRLDSEMGLQRDSKGDLDLELRLGYC